MTTRFDYKIVGYCSERSSKALSLLTLAVREKTFYMITNAPQIGRYQENIYLYAISKNGISDDDQIEFTKKTGLPVHKSQTGIIESDDIKWGYYLKLGAYGRFKKSRAGTYEAACTTADVVRIERTAFIKPSTDILNTKGVYTVTVFPEISGEDGLAGRNSIGVAWTPGCFAIKWCKGRRRNINTGPRLSLTSTKDAGIYTISRPSRGKRGWFVQIQVIVASCQKDQYLSGDSCVPRTITSCDDGSVLKDEADECLYPPYFTDYICANEFCPGGWHSFGGIDYRCYKAFDDQLNFDSYEAFCQTQDGHLASFHTTEEFNGVLSILGSSPHYSFGLNDRAEEGQFCYTDNSMFDITIWRPGQPDNFFNEDCVEFLVSNSLWNDIGCEDVNGGICMQVPCFNFVLGQDAGATLRCEDLEGGNPTCRGFLICLGDLYGCKCASGWHSNNCDRPCPKGKWGPGCELRCPVAKPNCDRFVG